MKKESSTRYIGLDANNARELGEMLTEASAKYREYNPQVIWNLSNGCSAFLVFEEVVRIPETIREEYEIRGEVYTCGDCPFKEPQTDGRNPHLWKCLRRPRGTDDDIKACEHFYRMLDEGRI